MKKRIISLILMLAMVLTFGLTGCGDTGANGDDADAEKYILKIEHLTTEEDSMHLGALYFKEILEDASEGRISVEIYPNKILASSDNEMLEHVRNNSSQMCITPNYIVAATNSELKHPYIFDFPYMFESIEELYAFCDGDMGVALDEEFLELSGGIKTYGPYIPAWYKIGTKNTLNSMADLKGQKIRTTTSKLQLATLKAFGAAPTPVNYGEVFTALQQGTVEGVACSGNLILTDRFYEALNDVAVTNHVAHVLYPCLSKLFYESLPEDLQIVLDESMVEYLEYIREYGETVEEDYLAELEQLVRVKRYTKEELKPWIAGAKSTWSENAEVCGGQEYIDQVQDFLSNYRKEN